MKWLEYYKGKTVLVTGHTGFKGSWLCVMLEMAGAKWLAMRCHRKKMPYYLTVPVRQRGWFL